ncbi:MAG: SDR family oxidoreductase [Actinomycetota bacterium]|nr:SDR family oxidoreductase [Actinomycetota bacterium]MDQ5807426.1 SDR family oxidoreductase [Actinomycetota bacterium]
MELSEKVVVVTGGASGIGKALAWRFGEEGARVAIADLRGAEDAAREVGALGIDCDVSDEQQVIALVDRVERELGPVDLFAANAGVGGGMGLDGFESALAVNVMQHVYAARRLVPGWLERGGGYFLSTASAAGLLTQIGSAAYSVSKHGAVAFAEWLSVTYGDQGVRVSVLCPMGVNTPMLTGGDEQAAQAAAVVGTAGAIIEPEQVADDVVAAVREERFLILPHPEVLTFFQRKGSDYDRWLAGMRRLQAGIVASFEGQGR